MYKTLHKKLEVLKESTGALPPEALKQLAELVHFAHPKQARKKGLLPFIKKHHKLFDSCLLDASEFSHLFAPKGEIGDFIPKGYR